MNLRFI